MTHVADRPRERAVVVGGASRYGQRIVGVLRDQGCDLVVVDPDVVDLDDAHAVAEVIEQAQPTAVIYAHVDIRCLTPMRFIEVEPALWDRACERQLRALLNVVGGSYRPLLRARGVLLCVCPTLALQGAENFVLWATVAEGQRILAKSAARQWAAEGVRVNILSPPVAAFVERPVHEDPQWSDALRGRVPMAEAFDGDAALRGALRFLLGPDGAQTTALTLTLDGAQVTAL